MMTADELKERLEALEAKIDGRGTTPSPPPPQADPETVKQDILNISKRLP